MKRYLAWTLLVWVFAPSALAVHPIPGIPQSCVNALANPHNPDPRTTALTEPAQRCAALDQFAIINKPTVVAAVIKPSSASRRYCTLDGFTIADPLNLSSEGRNEEAADLASPIPCLGDNVCTELFGEASTCENFGPDASGRSDNGWTSVGPASGFAIAAPLGGVQGVHSIYVRTADNQGHSFYFERGVSRTHSLTAPGSAPIVDITFCRDTSSPTRQQWIPPCDFFICNLVDCNGPHFPTAGEPNVPPLLPDPEYRLGTLEGELTRLVEEGRLVKGQANSMRKHLRNALRKLEQGKTDQTCKQLSQLVQAVNRSVDNGLLMLDATDAMLTEVAIVQDQLGCSAGKSR